MYRHQGFSLAEMLASLTIMSMLTVTAFPSVSNMLSRQETATATNRMVAAINLARHSAVQLHGITTLCGLKDDGDCGADWAEELTVFLDTNQNARRDDGEASVRIIPALTSEVSIKWRAFRNPQYLQMTPMGFTNYQNGNFTICPANGNQRWARQLVVNIQGRVRNNRQTNEAGYPIDRNGRLLRCQ